MFFPEATLHSTDERTRDRVMREISEHGPVTAAQLADTLGLTAAAVRRHLDCLAASAFVEEREPAAAGSRKRGRPARAYVLSDAGHKSLRGDYEDLATSLLRHLDAESGHDAVTQFARQRASDIGRRVAPQVAAAGPNPQARAQALALALTNEGYAASARPVANGTPLAGVQLCQGHCPVQHVAAEFPQFCEAEAEMFSETLGVHVQRLSSLAGGAHVCTTFIPTASSSSSERDPR